jgi:membrane protein YqaA with SNARE-associated domain
MLRRFVEFIQPFAASLGGPGLLLVALLDSSFVPLPEIPDFLLIWSVVRDPDRWMYYAIMTTVGSVLGCTLLYAVARKGGEAMLHRRFRAATAERALRAIRRYGVLAVIIPAILPPPFPFKVFVLLAGVSSLPLGPFLAAVAFGRGFRYTAEAWLAYLYGEQAIQYVHENLGRLSVWMAITVAVVGLAIIVWRRRRKT